MFSRHILKYILISLPKKPTKTFFFPSQVGKPAYDSRIFMIINDAGIRQRAELSNHASTFDNSAHVISISCSVTFFSLSTANALSTGLSLSISDIIMYTAAESYASRLSSSEGLDGVSGWE